MVKKVYTSPIVWVIEMSVSMAIAQSYGDPGKAGGPIYENPIDNW